MGIDTIFICHFSNLIQRFKYSLKKRGQQNKAMSILKYGEPIFFFVVWSLKENSFFICFLAAPQQTLAYYQGDSHCHSILITEFSHPWLVGCQEFVSRLGKNSLVSIDLRTAKRLLRFEPGSFRFDCNNVTH